MFLPPKGKIMPTLEPTCTCQEGKGWGLVRPGEKFESVGERIDPKGRRICQVHNPVSQQEWESRAFGGLDDFPRE